MSTAAEPDDATVPDWKRDYSGLPPDHPSRHRQRHQPQHVQEAQYRELYERAGLGRFASLLCNHPGTQSRLSAEGMHVAMLRAAADHKSYKRSDITAAAAKLTDECADAVSIDDRAKRPISYNTIARRLANFEDALVDLSRHPRHGKYAWLAENGMFRRAYKWSDRMIRASIGEWAHEITAIAIDGTCKHQWANPTECSTNDQLYLQHAQRRADELGLEEPDLTDRKNPCGTKPGELGPDGRPIRSKSPTARWGHRTKTPKDQREYFFGHDLIMGIILRALRWQGDPERYQPGDDVPQLIACLRVIPAGADPAPPSAAVAETTSRYMPNLRDVIADRIITNKPTFIQKLHGLGLNGVMDYTTTEVANPKLEKFGRNGNDYYVHVGGIYPGWAGPSVVTPPAIRGHKTLDDPDVTDEELAQWYIERAKNYRCSINRRLPDGGFQYQTPLAAGRIGTEHTMHTANQSAAEHPADTVYPEKFFIVAPEQAVRLQDRPWNTPAWEADYGRRPIIETGNSQVKDEAGFAAEKCRIFKFVAEIIHTTLIAVIHNLQEIRRYELKQQEASDKAAKNHRDRKHNGATLEPVTIATTDAQPNGRTPSTNGLATTEPDIEPPAEPKSDDTAEATASAPPNGLATDSRRAAAANPANSNNRRRRNKRRRQPQQRQQTPPNGRSPPQD